MPVELRFEARFDGRPVGCGTEADGAAMTDLRLYVYDVVLIDGNGQRAPVQLDSDDRWQNGVVALVDLEDGSGACLNGTEATNAVVRGQVAAGDYRGLEFVVGVPEALNHADPLTAGPPLNYTIMHWHWRSGYKFMRAGVETAGDEAWLHLGSARCAGTIGRIEGCQASNRPVVRFAEFDIGADRVIVDLARLFEHTGLGDGEPWNCQSGPGEAQCADVFTALGLQFSSGDTTGSVPAFAAGR